MKYLKSTIFILIMVVFISSFLNVYAQKPINTVVRVGFPIQKGISYIDDNGKYAGYLVDYLQYVKLYTNWEIEFVQVDGDIDAQYSTLMDMLQNGEIDMLGTMSADKTLRDTFLYPSYNYGITYITLAVPVDTPTWISEDFSHWNGIRVATYPGFDSHMKLLEQYAQINGFTYETLTFTTYDEVLEAVHSGKADATLQQDISMEDNLRPIARFSPSPYYFALYEENQQLMRSLNLAINNINQSFPYLKSQLYYKYFDYQNDFFISEEDQAFLQSLGTLKVLFYEGNAPFQYIKDGKITGCAYRYLEEFSKRTGLQFQPVIAFDYTEKSALIENKEIDLIAGVPTNSRLAQIDGIQFSLPYLYSYSVAVHSKDNQNLTAPENQIFCSNAENALKQINKDPNYIPKVDCYSFDFYTRKKGLFENLEVDRTTMQPFGYTVAVADHIPDRLLVLLNRFASSLDETQRQHLIYLYATDQICYTFNEFIYVYRYIIAAVLLILFSLSRQMLLHMKNQRSMQKIAAKEKEVNYLSCFDSLTGAYNERQFRKRFTEDCKNRHPKVLVALNLRDFKYINETFSSATADRFLCEIKAVLDKEMLADEYFCRQAADIFYLALSSCSKQRVMHRINHIRINIQQKAYALLDEYPISIYCGVVFTASSPESYSPSSNMGYMLAALAYAKRGNTEDICFYDEKLHQIEQVRHYVESHMHAALKNGEFKLYLQPKKNLATNQFDQAEALVRWQPRDGQTIYPNQFIPLFEENGFCVELDLYMVEQVCRQLRIWIDAGLQPIGISINQTKLLFSHAGYVEKLCAIAKKYNIPTKLITLELLEGLRLDDIKYLNHCIAELKKAGFHISLDDFGSGYSSLNVLGDLDIDELKVDRAFLMSESRSKNYYRRCLVVEQIIQLAKKIGVRTVAEGVETEEDEIMIKHLKYDYGQGYYYSKPIPADEYCENFLK